MDRGSDRIRRFWESSNRPPLFYLYHSERYGEGSLLRYTNNLTGTNSRADHLLAADFLKGN